MPEAGDIAPPFTLDDDQGQPVVLDDLRGGRVILYFYPKDDTPGCTTQACGLRDGWDRITATGVRLFGVSPDPVDSHAAFRAKFELPFPLLADTDHTVAEAYGVWVEKSMYGKRYMGVERTTFLIGADGSIERVWRKVKPADHLDLLLDALTGA